MVLLLLITIYYLIGLECTFQYYKRTGVLNQEHYSEIKAMCIDPFIMPAQWTVTLLYGKYLIVKNLFKRFRGWCRRRMDLYHNRIESYRVRY